MADLEVRTWLGQIAKPVVNVPLEYCKEVSSFPFMIMKKIRLSNFILNEIETMAQSATAPISIQ